MSRPRLLLRSAVVLTLLACDGGRLRILAGELWVGAATRSITPDRPVALEGFFHLRISRGVATPIRASVVVVESREGEDVVERSVFVSADLVHLPWEMLEAVRSRVAASRPDIDVGKIFISVTHTHAAPVVMRDNFILPEDPAHDVMIVAEYQAFFAERVADAIIEAARSPQRASLAWGLGQAHVAYSRRMTYLGGRAQMSGPTHAPDFQGIEGPEYQGIPTLFFLDGDGDPIAIAVNPWTPSQEEGGAGDRISADFWHPVRERLEARFGADLAVIAWCGPAGDQMTARRFHAEAEDRMRRLRGEESWVDEIGRRIAESVIETYELVREERHDSVRHVHRAETIRLPGWSFTEDELARLRTERDALMAELAEHPDRAPTLARPISWRAQTLERQAELAASEDGAFPTEIHVVRLGDVAIATNQFELFTEYGLRILGRSEAHLTFVVQLTGPAHYLPTAEAVRGGGYSAIPASCHAGPDGGQVLVDATVARLLDLWSELDATLPEEGQLVDGRPHGTGWVDLLGTVDGWDAEPEHWTLAGGVLRGESRGGTHHFAWTERSYSDFELHAVVRMTGAGANSGVGIRLAPESHERVPGYQIDMGAGYWGSLWAEGGGDMIQPFPPRLAARIVRPGDWNHYYIVAQGPRVRAWLNGVLTVDVVHDGGFREGRLGFELCHGDKHTILEVRQFAVREMRPE